MRRQKMLRTGSKRDRWQSRTGFVWTSWPRADQGVDDPFGSATIPAVNRLRLLVLSGLDLADNLPHQLQVAPRDRIRPMRDCNWPFGILPHSQAGDAEKRRLLLDAPGVCNGESRSFQECQHFPIAKRSQNPDARRSKHFLETECRDSLTGAGVKRQNNIERPRQFAQEFD